MIKELEFIRSRLSFVSNSIKDRVHSAFFYVLIPETMAILDTRRALEMFKAFDIHLSGIIVNMVYPTELLDQPDVPAYIKNRIKMQQKHMKVIEDEFGPLIKAVIPMFDREPKGLSMISKVSEFLFK